MNIKQLDQAIEEGESLQAIAQAYSEIANLKIKRIRAETERNRIFFQELSKVYGIIKKFAAEKGIKVTRPKNTVSIILTSNYRFYGRINTDLLEFFENSAARLETDKIYLGKAAVDYFRAKRPIRPAGNPDGATSEVILKSDQPDAAELQMLANALSQYSRIIIFYSSMKSLLTQVPTAQDITAATEHNPGLNSLNANFKFIFEPELPKILEFFDCQIITLLLEGTFLESELSRTASRFISMDQAETQANQLIKDYQVLKAYAKRGLDNIKILENFATIMAVRKEAD